MPHPRLSLALQSGLIVLPERVVVFGARAGDELSDLGRPQVVTPMKPDVDFFAAQGLVAGPDAPEQADLAVIFLPRAKDLARGMIARAARIAPLLVVDGGKTDGVDSMLKALRKLAEVSAPVNKAHGKLFTVKSPQIADWTLPDAPCQIEGGFQTRAGVFSADGVDPASRLLAEALPQGLGPRVADLGAGWGYLSARLLTQDSIRELHLVEADHSALACARANVQDPRAQFHWADATAWRAPAKLDTVVMNPPFHSGRKADPDLGRAFIAAASGNLSPRGTLYMVANRHLPYEPALAEHFGEVEEFGGDNRFKLIRAARPRTRKS